MATKKSPTKTKPKKTQRAALKRSATSGPVPPYGVAIREAIERGDVREMRRVAAAARKWQKNVETALARMEKSMKDLGG